jgi:hypothetical protein
MTATSLYRFSFAIIPVGSPRKIAREELPAIGDSPTGMWGAMRWADSHIKSSPVLSTMLPRLRTLGPLVYTLNLSSIKEFYG